MKYYVELSAELSETVGLLEVTPETFSALRKQYPEQITDYPEDGDGPAFSVWSKSGSGAPYGDKLAAMVESLRAYEATCIEKGDLSVAEAASEILKTLSPTMIRALFFQIIGTWTTGNGESLWAYALTKEGKSTAGQIAYEIGPDYAVGLFAFAALVNKLA